MQNWQASSPTSLLRKTSQQMHPTRSQHPGLPRSPGRAQKGDWRLAPLLPSSPCIPVPLKLLWPCFHLFTTLSTPFLRLWPSLPQTPTLWFECVGVNILNRASIKETSTFSLRSKHTHTQNGIYNTAKKAQHEQLKITFSSLSFPWFNAKMLYDSEINEISIWNCKPSNNGHWCWRY